MVNGFSFQHKRHIQSTKLTISRPCPQVQSQLLSPSDELLLQLSLSTLRLHDETLTHKARFLSQTHALQDKDCLSKHFFDNQNRTSIVSLVLDDGSIVTDADSQVMHCVDYFGTLLSRPTQNYDLKSFAVTTMLNHVPHCILLENGQGLESPFLLSEVFYALCHLPNAKTPGIDGLSREFIVLHWDLLADMVVTPSMRSGLLK